MLIFYIKTLKYKYFCSRVHKMEGPGKKLAIQIIILGDGAVGKTSMIN